MLDQPSRVSLVIWEEIVGVFQGISVDPYHVVVHVSERDLVYHADSVEGGLLKQQLSSVELGAKIGILRTDKSSRPLLLRIIP